MAQIQGHLVNIPPSRKWSKGRQRRISRISSSNYAANANYFDYKIGRKLADGSYQVVGDQGIKLGRPELFVAAFPAAVATEVSGGKEQAEREKQETRKFFGPGLPHCATPES